MLASTHPSTSPLTLADLRAKLHRMASEGRALHATAPVERICGMVLEDLARLDLAAPPADEPGGMLTVRDVCQRLRVSKWWVSRHSGGWDCTRRVGRALRFDRQAFERAVRDGRITGGRSEAQKHV